MNLEQVEREVIGRELEGARERGGEAAVGLRRDADHQVEREVLESGRARPGDDLRRARRVVAPPEQAQLAIDERLHSHREPVHSRRPQSGEAFAAGDPKDSPRR